MSVLMVSRSARRKEKREHTRIPGRGSRQLAPILRPKEPSKEPLQPAVSEADKATVLGRLVVGNAGQHWTDDTALDADERRDAEKWLRARYKFVPGVEFEVTWLRADRIVQNVCPGPTCKRIGSHLGRHLYPGQGVVNEWECLSCGRKWRHSRTGEKDTLVLTRIGR